MKSKKLIIFGAGQIAQLAKFYFDCDSDYEVAAFAVDKEYRKQDFFENKPLIDFETVQSIYSIRDYSFFIALSYSNLNKLRAEKYNHAKDMGYTIASYISSKCNYLSAYPAGENAFILEDNTIQPYAKIGNNVTIWSGNHIGHHTEIHDHNFISSHVVISGNCKINSFCFLGVNASIAHNLTVATQTILGAGAIVTKDTEANTVYVMPQVTTLEKRSDQIKL
jgi:sugar O-acyltransferase (sialic acid O-acetyltransferase NeuD family)